MAIQWADNFTSYGTGGASRTAMLDGLPYSVIDTGAGTRGTVTTDPDPNSTTGFAFTVPDGGTNVFTQFRVSLPTVVSGKLNVAHRMWMANLPTNDTERPIPIGFLNVSGGRIAYVVVSQNGSIKILSRVANVEVVIADTVNPVVAPNSYYHYELEHNPSTGEGKFYLDAVEILSWTGADVDDGPTAIVCACGAFGNTTGVLCYIKDLVIQDGTGTQNTGQIGNVVVLTLRPDGDVTTGDWTPSTGSTIFNLINKVAVNDATYVSVFDTPMPSSPFELTLNNLPPDIVSVRALISVVRARKIDGGDGDLQTGLKGTATDLGTNRPVTVAFKYSFDVSELSPDTSAPWTPVQVDAATLVADRTL